MFFDPLYMLFMIPPLILGFWAQSKIQSTYGRYSQVRTRTNISGAEAARRILDSNGLHHVDIERVRGTLSDHYDPRGKVLRLSEGIYAQPSLAAVGVAAHEAGHAIQDATGYAPLRLRSAMVPAVRFGSWLGPIIFMGGLFLSSVLGNSVAWLGILLFAATALFAVVTLPVEFDASRRAKKLLVAQGILGQEEVRGVDKVLDAAAWTYVAAAMQAVLQLAYFAFILVGRDDR